MTHDSRRKSFRIHVSLAGTILVGKRSVSGRVLNINLSGFFIAISEPVPVGELVKLELEVPDGQEPMACFGWVRSCDLERTGGAGVQLFAMTREQHDRWVTYYQEARREMHGDHHLPPKARARRPAVTVA